VRAVSVRAGEERRPGRTDGVGDYAHLVELGGADVRAVREAKVQERPLALQVLLRVRRAVVRGERERAADVRAPDGARGELLRAARLRLLLLVPEVREQARARREQERGRRRREHLCLR
jgi:hypothetical protein